MRAKCGATKYQAYNDNYTAANYAQTRHERAPNDEGERRGVAQLHNEAALSRSSTPSLAHQSHYPAIARTDG